MNYSAYGKWKYVIENGMLRRECTNCKFRQDKQPLFCSNCNAYMRERSK
jgi:hypothetical protein